MYQNHSIFWALLALNTLLRETGVLCVVLVLLPHLELLSSLPGELLKRHLVDLAPNLLLHLGDFLFGIDSFSFGVLQHKFATKQVSIFERFDTILRFTRRLEFREGKPTSVMSLLVPNHDACMGGGVQGTYELPNFFGMRTTLSLP